MKRTMSWIAAAVRHCALTYDIADYGSGNFSVALYKSELAYPTQIFNKN
jgi:hypothetical protein